MNSINNTVGIESRNNLPTVNNNENHEITSQTTGNSLTTNDSIFSEIDVNEFREEYNAETLANVSEAFSNGNLKLQDLQPIMLNSDNISGIYAKRVAQLDGKTQIVIVFRNFDGFYTDDILIPNSDLFDVAYGEMESATDQMKREAAKALKRIRNKMLQYWDGTGMFDPKCVVGKIILHQNSLPLDNSQLPNLNKVYATIVDMANEKKNHPGYCGIFRKGFYAFPTNLFDEIAEKIQMTSTNLAKFLKRNGLLYLQGSSMGYQSYVSYMGENCYCVKTLQKYQQEVDPQSTPEELYKML